MQSLTLCSVRVSNELGASHPRTAKFLLVVAVVTSFLIGVALSLALIITRGHISVFVFRRFGGESSGEATHSFAGYLYCYKQRSNSSLWGRRWSRMASSSGLYEHNMLLCIWGSLGPNHVLQASCGCKGILFSMICKTSWNKEVTVVVDRYRIFWSVQK